MTNTSRAKFMAPSHSPFFTTLKKRVDAYFHETERSRYGNNEMAVKSVVLLGIYLVPFVLIATLPMPLWLALFLWFLMGLGVAGIGMSIMHDANHGAYSKKNSVNKWMGRSIYLAGAGVINWKIQHNVLHHTYTNVVPLDQDIRDRGLLKFTPHDKPGKIHRFQWVYAVFLYACMTLYWVTLKDFTQYFGFIRSGWNKQSRNENHYMIVSLIVLKLVYFSVLLGLPMLLAGATFAETLAGFLIMHFTSGIVLTVIFQLAHTVECTNHPVIDANGVIHKDWATHQLETTVNFCPGNRWLSWYIGGLNFQIEHHLFPKICHVHYPDIAPIVQKTAEEFGIRYMQTPSFRGALKAHVRALQEFGRLPEPDEAIG